MATTSTPTPTPSERPNGKQPKAPTLQELLEQMKALEQHNAELAKQLEAAQTKQAGTLTWKTSSNGGLILYGVGRFPITLKAEQWRVVGNVCCAEGKNSLQWALEQHLAGTLAVKQVAKDGEEQPSSAPRPNFAQRMASSNGKRF